jgi:aconitate hydratase 2/2-methylisocitrate dehydratase
VIELAATNPYAQQVVDSWAVADWFTAKSELPAEITVMLFKVEGETNTEDLSPATHATTRPDIPPLVAAVGLAGRSAPNRSL